MIDIEEWIYYGLGEVVFFKICEFLYKSVVVLDWRRYFVGENIEVNFGYKFFFFLWVKFGDNFYIGFV